MDHDRFVAPAQSRSRALYLQNNVNSSEIAERIHANHKGRVQYAIYSKGKSGEPVEGRMKASTDMNSNTSNDIILSNFQNANYREPPLGCRPGLRKNSVTHEWREGSKLVRGMTRSKKSPSRSPLARNAEINMFTGFVKEGPAELNTKEVHHLRGVGVMAAGAECGTRPRVNGVL